VTQVTWATRQEPPKPSHILEIEKVRKPDAWHKSSVMRDRFPVLGNPQFAWKLSFLAPIFLVHWSDFCPDSGFPGSEDPEQGFDDPLRVPPSCPERGGNAMNALSNSRVRLLIGAGLFVFTLGLAPPLLAEQILQAPVTTDTLDPVTGRNFTYLSTKPSTGSAGLAFRATSCADDSCTSTHTGLYRIGTSTELLVDTLTLMPGEAVPFSYFSDPRQSGSDVVFQASANNQCPPGPCGIYVIKDGALHEVAASGKVAPGGGVYQLTQSPVMRDGVLAFGAYVDRGGSLKWEIHADFGSGVTSIVDGSSVVPGTDEPFFDVGQPDTAEGRVVFTGTRLEDYSRAIYAYEAGEIRTLIDETTPVPGETWTIDDAYNPAVKGDVLAFQGWTSDHREGLFADFGAGIELIVASMTPVPGTGQTINWIHPPAIMGDSLFFTVEDTWYGWHLLVHQDGQLYRLLGTGSQLDGKTVWSVSLGTDSALDGVVTFQVRFDDGTSPRPEAIYLLRLVDGEIVIEAVPDLSGDALPELATVLPDLETGTSTAHLTNPMSGAEVATVAFDEGRVLGLVALPDIGASSAGEIAVLLERGTERPITQTRDSASGALIRNQNYFDADWLPRDIVTIPDLDDEGDFPEVAVLAVNQSTGEIGLQIRDGATGQFIRNLFFLNENWAPLKVVVVPDIPGSATAAPEIGLLARHTATGQIVVMLKDAGSNVFTGNVFYLNANWQPRDLLVLDSFSGSDGPALALLATNNDTGLIVTMIKHAADNEFLLNLFHLGSNWTPVGISLVDDVGTGAPEVTVLGLHKEFNSIVAQSKDSETNVFVSNARPLGSAWLPLAMIRLGNLDQTGGDEIAVLAIRRSDGKIVVQTMDIFSGAVLSNGFLN
jgi:hypothetical protein